MKARLSSVFFDTSSKKKKKVELMISKTCIKAEFFYKKRHNHASMQLKTTAHGHSLSFFFRKV